MRCWLFAVSLASSHWISGLPASQAVTLPGDPRGKDHLVDHHHSRLKSREVRTGPKCKISLHLIVPIGDQGRECVRTKKVIQTTLDSSGLPAPVRLWAHASQHVTRCTRQQPCRYCVCCQTPRKCFRTESVFLNHSESPCAPECAHLLR